MKKDGRLELHSKPHLLRVPLGTYQTLHSKTMTFLLSLILVCVVSCCGCSAIGTRVVGGGYFSGVRGDATMIADRQSVDPLSRVHPALAALDMPFSFIGDVLFLPYDACRSN
jgi:uncharacterized protein YceK